MWKMKLLYRNRFQPVIVILKNPNFQKKHFELPILGYSTPVREKIAFILIGLLGLNVVAFFLQLILAPIKNSGDYGLFSILVNFVSYLIIYGVFLLIIFLDKHRTYKKVFNGFKSLKPYLVGLVGFAAILMLQLILGNLFSLIPFYGSNNNEKAIDQMVVSMPVLSIIMTVIFAPFVEEITYRAGFCDLIGRKNKWLGIIFSAVIFGLIHFDTSPLLNYMSANAASSIGNEDEALNAIDAINVLNITQAKDIPLLAKYYLEQFYVELINLPIYIGSGMILALTYRYSGELSSSIVAHMGLNLFAVVSQLIASSIPNSQQVVALFSHLII